MDDRQPVSPFRRILSYVVCYLIAVQPMLPAAAAVITPVTPGTQMDAAGNGVPVVNIATPNQAGISHNQYQQYNVGSEGLILNNATGQLTQTQLGGLIQNNPNLAAGHEAQAIINEVTGASRTQLQGYTEVAGKAASVMVANPYGITCNGCGFINTPNVTLTTGKPQLDASGNLSALEVTKGSVTIEGQGLDGSRADAVSIVARATQINAGIYAKDLSITAGANRVGADGSVTPIAGEGELPTVAVDTGALGGMYANRIHLVSNEKGVGVNLGNLVAKQGDIQLDASGNLTLNNSLSSGALAAKGSSVSLSGDNKASGQITVSAQQDATLNGGTLVSDGGIAITAQGNLAVIGSNLTAGSNIALSGANVSSDKSAVAKAGGDIQLQAQNRLLNSGQLTAGKDLSISAQQLANSGMLAGNTTSIRAGSLENDKGAALSGVASLQVDSDSLLNQGVFSAPVLTLNSTQTDNSGLLQGSSALSITGNRLSNLAGGTLSSDNSFSLNLPQLSNSGLITSGAALTLSGQALTNAGEINAASIAVSNAQFNNQKDGLLLADGGLQMQNDVLSNDGQIAGSQLNIHAAKLDNSGTLQGQQALQVAGTTLTNGGTLLSSGQLTLNTGSLSNAGLLQGQQLTLTTGDWQNSGNALSAADASLTTGTLNNSGEILGQQAVQLRATTADNSGSLLAQTLTLQGDWNNSGLVQGNNALTLHVGDLSNQVSGQLLTAGTLEIQGNNLDNQGTVQGDRIDATLQSWQNAGSALASTGFTANINGPLVNSGTLLSQNGFDLFSNNLTNTGSLAADRLNITAPQISNAGLLQGNNELSLDSASIVNTTSGQLISGSALTLNPLQLTNAGLLQVAGDFSLTGRDFSNSGRVTATNLSVDMNGTLDNQAGGTLLAELQSDLQATALNNAGTLAAQHLNATGDTLQNRGLMQGNAALEANFSQFSNLNGGQLLSGGDLRLTGTTGDNAGLVQGKDLSYQFGTLTNSSTLNGTASLTGTTDTLLDNSGYLVTDGNASVTTGRLLNSGKIMADSLVLQGDTLNNSGLWQGTTALRVQASDSLTQTATGKTLTAGDLLLNAGSISTAGALQGNDTDVTADSWQHQGTLLATGGLSASVSGELDNSGELLSQDAAQITAQNIVNSGSLLAEKAITLRGGALSNSGTVQGDTLTVTPANVTNQGSLIGLQSLTFGPATQFSAFRLLAAQDQPARVLNNDVGGQLLTQGTLSISGDTLTNNGVWQGQQILLDASHLTNNGAIQSADGLTLTLSDTLTSAAGSKITANGTAALNALSLTNQGQWVADNLTVNGITLTNSGSVTGVDGLTVTLSGALTQQQAGSLLSDGNLNLEAASTDNAGRIQGGDLTLSGGAVNNSGRLQGDNSLLLTTSGRMTNNASGTLLSQNTLTLTTPELYNYGLIQGATSHISASSTATNTGKVLSGGELTLNTPQLSNSGWIQAAQLILNATNAGNSGTLLADQQGTLTGTQLLNQGSAQGGNLTVNYDQLNNSGTLLGANQLNVKATQVTQQAAGKLFSGGNLLLNSTGFEQLGQVVALGDATLNLINSFTGRDTLAAGNHLSISSNGTIDNQGTMQGQALTLSAGGDLTNSGQITTGTGDSTLSGNRVVLNGSGTLQGGGNVSLNSRSDVTLNGFTGTRGNLTISSAGSVVNTALLYAGQDLSLFGNSILNQHGDMLAGNNLRMQRDTAGNASDEVINTSGSIESQNGDINIKTGHLLNTRDGLSTSEQVTQLDVPDWATGANVSIPLSWFSAGDYGLYTSSSEDHHGHGDDWTTYTGSYALYADADANEQRVAIQTINVTASASGGAARIAAGKDLNVQSTQLDNFASLMLAQNDIALTGNELNNKSWTDGSTTVYQIYHYALGARPSTNPPSYSSITSRSIPFVLDGSPEYETTGSGNVFRSVIQAGNNIEADFAQNVSNTSTDPHISGAVSTLDAPTLNTLSQQAISGSQQKQALSATDRVEVNSPAWKDQVENALQQINGGGTLETGGDSNVSLASLTAGQKGNASLGNAKAISDASTGLNATTPEQHQAKRVDNSAYPVPTSDNGYFVVSQDSSSPYLITVNPKLDGLGQLDSSVFGDLNTLLGKQPGNAPQETRQQYTDVNTMLGSSYLLDRLDLKPDNDYRFLGDAAFDTRYVSNTVLNQTGSQYLNGVGSDLEQMQYLMDNAAAARQSLDLQFGVALTADQVASLDHSILWWESTTINGETVMVPKLYLSPKDTAVNNGSVIAARNVSVTGGTITNSGSTLLADNALSLDSQNSISNLKDGLVKASGDLNLSAIGDINNVSSTFQGKTLSMESLDGSINNITLSNPLDLDNSGSGSLKNIQPGSTASISAEQNLTLSAGKNITLTGASLSAGNDLLMNAWGDVAVNANPLMTTAGSGGNRPVQTDTVTYQSSQVNAGGNLVVNAGHDIGITASDLTSAGNASLTAANDLQLNAGQTSQNSVSGNKETHSTDVDRSVISSGGNLTLSAGQDLNSQAASLGAKGDVGLQAGRDINLNAEASGSGNSEHSSKKTVINESIRQQGTEITSGGSTSLAAGRDITSQAAQVNAIGDLALNAGRDVNITTATESDYAYNEETKTSKGFLSKKTTHTIAEDSATSEKGTLLSGNNVSVSAGNDMLVRGSQVVGDGKVALSAENNVVIDAATNTDSTWRFSETKKSGLMGTGGLGISIGTSKTLQEMKDKGTTQSQSVSTVGSTSGDVAITAGKQLQVNGADLVAGGSMALQGDGVAITPGHDVRTHDERFEQKSTGLTLALSGAVAEAVNSAIAATQAAKQEGDSRLAALQATKAVLSGVQATQASQLAEAKGDPNNGVGISISLTTQSSKSEQHQSSDQVSGSTINAGNNLSINATGKSQGENSGDLLIAGSQLKAGGDTTLNAANDITLAGAASTQQTTGKNSSSGGGIGLSFGVGQGSAGISIFASVNGAKGHDTGNGTVWSETTLDSGGDVSLTSGRDTTLSGAQVNGSSVTADIGRDLSISSLQDSDNYDSKQSSFGAGGSFTFGSMSGSGYINASQDKMHSTYDSVIEQSGIYAGEGGFDITVGNHTQLNGAVIASQAEADKNRLDTGTLGFTDIHNQADYSVEHQGIGLSSGASLGGQFVGNMASTLLAGAGSSGHAEGTTQSAVAEGTITVRDQANQTQDVATLSRDTANANDSISPIFDKEKEQKRLQTAQMIGEISTQVADIARTQGEIAGTKAQNDHAALQAAKEALAAKGNLTPTDDQIADQAYNTAMAPYGTGSSLQRGIQAATAAVQGLAGGDLAAAIAGASAPYLASIIHDKTTTRDANGNEVVNTTANLMAHAVLGAVVAAASGNNGLSGAAGAVTGEYIAQQLYPGVDRADLSEEQRQTISTLSTLAAGLAGGIAGGDTGSAVTGAQAGKNAVENNYLHVSEKTELEIAKQKLNSSDPVEREAAQKKVAELTELSISRDQKVMDACGNGKAASAGCAGARLEVISAKGEYETGQYNNKVSDMYADSYGQIVNLLNITSVDAQNQQQVKDAMVNYAMQQFGVDEATAEQYISTYDGMKTVAASMAPVLGAAAANKISALGQVVVKESVPDNPNSSSAITDAEAGGYSYYDRFKNADGGWDWPKNLGFSGEPVKTTIPVGTTLDRYGDSNGAFLAPKDTPYEQRALAPGSQANGYHEYEVMKPLPAIQGTIAPAFGQVGGGTQILPNMTERVNVQWLIDNGYLKEIH